MVCVQNCLGYAKSMKSIFTLLLLLPWLMVSAETVYKTVDEDGNVVFSDQPSDDAEVIQLQEVQTIDNPNKARLPSTSNRREAADPAEYYQAFSFISPEPDEGYRNNAGNLSVSLSLQPGLQRGHKVVIKLDGNEIANGKALSASVQNVDRGTHSLSATVVDNAGKTLISANTSFTMLRVSKLAP